MLSFLLRPGTEGTVIGAGFAFAVSPVRPVTESVVWTGDIVAESTATTETGSHCRHR